MTSPSLHHLEKWLGCTGCLASTTASRSAAARSGLTIELFNQKVAHGAGCCRRRPTARHRVNRRAPELGVLRISAAASGRLLEPVEMHLGAARAARDPPQKSGRVSCFSPADLLDDRS